MTIGAGFLCGDGLVLAANTLYTGISKRHAAKVWWFEKGPNLVALAGAGEAVLIRRTREELERHLTADMDESAIVNLADSVVYGLLRKAAVKDDDELTIELLLGLRTSAGLSLRETQGGTLFAPVDSCRQCIGCGNSLGLYFADWLFQPGMPSQWVRTIAAHLLKQTKRYATDCGGDSQIVSVPAIGEPHCLMLEEITALEGQLEQIEAHMRKVLVFAPGIPPDVTADTIKVRMGALASAATLARQTFTPLGFGVEGMYLIHEPEGSTAATPLTGGE